MPTLGPTFSKKSAIGPAPVCIKSPTLSLVSFKMSESISCSTPYCFAPAAISWNLCVLTLATRESCSISRAKDSWLPAIRPTTPANAPPNIVTLVATLASVLPSPSARSRKRPKVPLVLRSARLEASSTLSSPRSKSSNVRIAAVPSADMTRPNLNSWLITYLN